MLDRFFKKQKPFTGFSGFGGGGTGLTGGLLTDDFSATGSYTYIPGDTSPNGSNYFVFTGPGTVATNLTWEFELLLVGGGGNGGGGGFGISGGGGAGGVQHYTNFSMEPGTHTIEVGSGDSTIDANGQPITLTAKQGGAGGAGQNGQGVPGGSGGGAGSRQVGVGNGTGGTAIQPAQTLVAGMGGANWGSNGGGSTDSAAGGGGGSGPGNGRAFPNFGTDYVGPALASPTLPFITTSGRYGKGGGVGSGTGAAGGAYGAGGQGRNGAGYQGIVIFRWVSGERVLP